MKEHPETASDEETETTGSYSKAGEMNVDTKSFKSKGIYTPTEDTQPHLAGNTAACTLDYSEFLNIM